MNRTTVNGVAVEYSPDNPNGREVAKALDNIITAVNDLTDGSISTTTVSTGTVQSATAATLVVKGTVADAGTAIKLAADVDLTSGKILTIGDNQGTSYAEKVSVDFAGAIVTASTVQGTTLTGTTALSSDAVNSRTAATLVLKSTVADAGTAVKIAANTDLTSGTILTVGDNQGTSYAEKFKVAYDGATTVSGVLTLPTGAVGAPSVNFGDADTGFYSGGLGQVNFTANGTNRVLLGTGSVSVQSVDSLRNVDGAVGEPGYTFNGDTDTGMYRSGTNTLDFATGGTKRVTIDSSGRVKTVGGVISRLFWFENPAVASTTGVHASYAANAGDIKAELDLDTPSAALDTIVEASTAGAAGNSITVAAVGDSAPAGGVTIQEVGNAVTIHFEDGVSTVANVETAITASSTLIDVKTPGTGATVLTSADNFTATNLAGGADGVNFPGAFSNPAIPRNVTVTFAAGWDAGDVTINGTDQFDAAVSETIADAAGTTVAGTKIFKTITSATKQSVGAAADGASIGYGDKIGLLAPIVSTFGMLQTDNTGEAVTVDATYHAFTPATAPNGVHDYKILVNV